MIRSEHPQVIAIILSVVEPQVAADVLAFLAKNVRAEVVDECFSRNSTALRDGRARSYYETAVADNTSAASATFELLLLLK